MSDPKRNHKNPNTMIQHVTELGYKSHAYLTQFGMNQVTAQHGHAVTGAVLFKHWRYIHSHQRQVVQVGILQFCSGYRRLRGSKITLTRHRQASPLNHNWQTLMNRVYWVISTKLTKWARTSRNTSHKRFLKTSPSTFQTQIPSNVSTLSTFSFL
jgi:hypothetical protein